MITEGLYIVKYACQEKKGEKTMGTYEKFLIYIEEFEYISDYSNEEVGELLRALIHFVKTGEEPFLAEKLRCPFRFMSAHIKRDRESYINMIEKKRAGGKKGAEVRYGKKYDDTEGKSENKSDEIESSDSKEAKSCVFAQNQSFESKNIQRETENNVSEKTKVEQMPNEKFTEFCEYCSEKQKNSFEKSEKYTKSDEFCECKQENNDTQNEKMTQGSVFCLTSFGNVILKSKIKKPLKMLILTFAPIYKLTKISSKL